jgi:hypothetical protein
MPSRALRLLLQPHAWPGVNTRSIPADWSGWEALRFDVVALQDMTLCVRIDDADSKGYDSRYNSPGIFLSKGRNAVTIWLSDIAARVDVRRLKALFIYAADVAAPQTLHLDNIRLEGP